MPHKVVINRNHGGFNLSEVAVALLIDRGVIPDREYFEVLRKNLVVPTDDYYDYVKDIPRHNKDLVQIVEALGRAASGMSSKLIVVELDGNKYMISDYDGFESIVEPSDLEWIVIR